LCYLVGPARGDVLMTFAAALRVVGRPEPFIGAFGLLEDEPVVVEGSQRDDVVLVQRVEGRPLRIEAVRETVETGRCVFESRRGEGFSRGRPRLCALGIDDAVGRETRLTTAITLLTVGVLLLRAGRGDGSTRDERRRE